MGKNTQTVAKSETTRSCVAYTCGVFDLFHRGHVEYLKLGAAIAKKAKAEFIVGVQDDESVYKQKGRLPIVTLPNRKAIIENLQGVDKVIDYSNPYQAPILKSLKVTHFIVSELYGTDDMDQKDTLDAARELHIVVSRIPYYHGISTSHIRERAALLENLDNNDNNAD